MTLAPVLLAKDFLLIILKTLNLKNLPVAAGATLSDVLILLS